MKASIFGELRRSCKQARRYSVRIAASEMAMVVSRGWATNSKSATTPMQSPRSTAFQIPSRDPISRNGLISTPAVSALIREAKTHELPNVLQSGRDKGMHRIDDSLERLVKNGVITREEAIASARQRSRFERPLTPVGY